MNLVSKGHGRVFNSAEIECIYKPMKSQSCQSLFESDSEHGETRC